MTKARHGFSKSFVPILSFDFNSRITCSGICLVEARSLRGEPQSALAGGLQKSKMQSWRNQRVGVIIDARSTPTKSVRTSFTLANKIGVRKFTGFLPNISHNGARPR